MNFYTPLTRRIPKPFIPGIHTPLSSPFVFSKLFRLPSCPSATSSTCCRPMSTRPLRIPSPPSGDAFTWIQKRSLSWISTPIKRQPLVSRIGEGASGGSRTGVLPSSYKGGYSNNGSSSSSSSSQIRPYQWSQKRTITSVISRIRSISIPGREPFIECLPEYANDPKTPFGAKLLLGLSAIPLLVGTYYIHAEKEGVEPRDIICMQIHYLSALLTYAGAMHWGLMVTEFSMPPASQVMTLYYFARFGLPIVPMSLAWLASSMSALFPRDAVMWLATAFTSLLGMEFLAHVACFTPAWYIRLRAVQSGFIFIALAGMLLSESMLEMGKAPLLQM